MIEIFEKELNYIEDENLRKFAEYCLERVPDYFFHIPASSTGKYHPEYSLGEGGLVRHTKAAMKIANDIGGLTPNPFGGVVRHLDEVLFALLFHDTFKKGWPEEEHTHKLHPEIAAKYIMDWYEEYPLKDDIDTFVMDNIELCIWSHMGQWDADGELMRPYSPDQLWTHMFDYLASRKYLHVEI